MKNTTRYILLSFIICICLINAIQAQIQVEGYVFEANNRGYLFGADVLIKKKESKVLVLKTTTDETGIWKQYTL